MPEDTITPYSPGAAGLAVGQGLPVYANSLAELECMKAAGLTGRGAVRTASPALAQALGGGAVARVPAAGADLVRGIFAAFEALALDAFHAVAKGGDRHLALAVAQSIWRSQRLAYDAALLEEQDFEGPVALAALRSDSAKVLAVFRYRWERLLQDNPEAQFCEVDLLNREFDFVAPPVAGFWRRLRHTAVADILYRLAVKASGLGRRLPGFAPVYLRSAPDLFKDAAPWLLRRRLWPCVLPAPPHRLEDGGPVMPPAIESELPPLEAMIRERLAEWLGPKATSAVVREILSDVSTSASSFVSRRDAWRRHLGALRPRPAAIVATAFAGDDGLAMASAAAEAGIPLAAVQHGATRELSANHDANPVHFETNTADLYLTFNREHARLTDAGSLGGGRCAVAGAPGFYRPARRRRVGNDAKPVWYISSGLYMGAQDYLHRALSDHETADFESGLITEVFGRCDRQIVYKPYPARRYADPDPVVELARAAPGVELIDHALDLRYFVGQAGLLIVSRTGSTIGYCLCQDIPLVYVKAPGRGLAPRAEAGLEAAVFLFDADTPDFHDRLRGFLALPSADIARQWRDKAAARDAFLKEFIAERVGGAGRRIAGELARLAREGRPEP